jgi:H+/Cl- antiporter ClcA
MKRILLGYALGLGLYLVFTLPHQLYLFSGHSTGFPYPRWAMIVIGILCGLAGGLIRVWMDERQRKEPQYPEHNTIPGQRVGRIQRQPPKDGSPKIYDITDLP